jgi:hypothetical protein
MHIELHSPAGQRHCITSMNHETVGRWIVETYAELATHGWDLFKYPPRVMVYPGWNPETREADWVCDTRILSPGFEASSPRQLLEGITRQVEQGETT